MNTHLSETRKIRTVVSLENEYGRKETGWLCTVGFIIPPWREYLCGGYAKFNCSSICKLFHPNTKGDLYIQTIEVPSCIFVQNRDDEVQRIIGEEVLLPW